MNSNSPLRLLAAGALAALAFAPAAVMAQASDPGVAKIESFDNALISTMKEGKAGANAEARFKSMAPAVDSTFNLADMTAFAVGPSWTSMSAEDKAALVSAFRRFTIASYAKNFASYDGQKITADPNAVNRGPDKVVKTQMTGGGADVVLAYRMRQSGGTWKVIDVLYNGAISQLTTQRSDFSATLGSGGAKALIAKLNAQSDKLLG